MHNLMFNNSEIELSSTNLCLAEEQNLTERRQECRATVLNGDVFNLEISYDKTNSQENFFFFEAEIEELPRPWLYNKEECSRSIKVLNQVNHEDQYMMEERENEELTGSTIGETKNIPKNFGKQIIKFVKKNESIIQGILKEMGSKVKYPKLNGELQKRKNHMNKISDLKELWLQKTKYGREIRTISCVFLRKYAFSWVFNSRITDFQSHLKYRSILLRFISKPESFVALKSDF